MFACFLLALLSLNQPAASSLAPAPGVLTGIDVLVAENFKPLLGKRVGLVTNPTGMTRDRRSTVDVLHTAGQLKLVALYGPEHGVRGDVPAGDHVEDGRDPATGIPAFSLYGKTRKPTAEMLKGVDVLVYDIQDIGCRSYTYISTMAVVMEAAAESKIPVVVLDRPNPVGGERIEGRPLDLKFKSFVGHLPIPYRYGLTCGELARMINGEGWLAGGVKCDLTVVPLRGWKREMDFEATGLHWVPASPHVPRADSAYFYIAIGILGELGVVSEGVGHTLPFEIAAAPWIDPQAFAAALNARSIPGVWFRPMYCQPFYGKFAKERIGGVQIHLTDRRRVPLTAIQFHLMDVVRAQHADQKLFGGKRDGMFDKVCGTDQVRQMFQAGKSLRDILALWDADVEAFRLASEKYLLYR